MQCSRPSCRVEIYDGSIYDGIFCRSIRHTSESWRTRGDEGWSAMNNELVVDEWEVGAREKCKQVSPRTSSTVWFYLLVAFRPMFYCTTADAIISFFFFFYNKGHCLELVYAHHNGWLSIPDGPSTVFVFFFHLKCSTGWACDISKTLKDAAVRSLFPIRGLNRMNLISTGWISLHLIWRPRRLTVHHLIHHPFEPTCDAYM